MDNFNEILEAVLFASGSPRKRSEILEAFGGRINKKELDDAIGVVAEKYSGESGVVLVQFNDKLQFSTNTKFGEIVAEVLTPLKEKELSKVLIEVLAIIAYKQPVTRLEIEKIKGTSAEYALSVLIKADLIEVIGRKEVVGRPALYGTTEEFLKKFQLFNIGELPDFESVLAKLEELGEYNKIQIGLYRDVDERKQSESITLDPKERLEKIERIMNADSYVDDIMNDEDEIPDFLQGDEYEVVQ